MENVGLFPEFQNYKMAATSCYIFLLACVASVSVWFREQREMFGFGRAPRSLLRNSTETLAKQATFLFFPVILACARVLLWRLAIALEQMLPAGEVYFRLVMSSKPPSKPRVKLIFLQWSTVFWILFFAFHKVSRIRFCTWESFISFHLWGSPFSTSLACLLSVTLEIEFRGKRGVGMRTMGAERSSRASSYLVYYIVWRVNLSKLSRNKDNNN